MRATLFLSALFAVSLVGGAALAERPGEGTEGRHPAREPKVQDLKPREASTVREARHHEVRHEKSTRSPAVLHERPNRGDNIDRAYGRQALSAHERTQKEKDLRAGTMPLNKSYESKRNCSDTGQDCSAHRAKAAGNASDEKVAKKESQHEMTFRERAKVQEMIKKLHQMMCEKHAAHCADYL
jgi:hypothetical protein